MSDETRAATRKRRRTPGGRCFVVLLRGGLRVAEALALGERDLAMERLGLGTARRPGSRVASNSRSGRSSASSTARPARAPLVERQCTRQGSPARRPSGHPASLRAAPAAPRRRRRARTRGVPLNVIRRQLGHANLSGPERRVCARYHRRPRPRPICSPGDRVRRRALPPVGAAARPARRRNRRRLLRAPGVGGRRRREAVGGATSARRGR